MEVEMQKWEYLYLSNSDRGYGINGVRYKYNQGEDIFMILNKLGQEGWELVAQPSIGIYTFKRPLSN